MSQAPSRFRAFVAERHDAEVVREVRELDTDALGEGDALIRVEWSGVNYKDALATIPKGRVARLDTLIPGIDLAGHLVDPGTSGLATGDAVLAHGYGLGVSHHGGFTEYARIPSEWLMPLPKELTPRAAMEIGTAGFTAGLSVLALEERGLTPDAGPVLVTGATGGVGSVAVSILAGRGYEVTASTGKADSAPWLEALGASAVVNRSETSAKGRPLERERWAGAVDCVGGDTLAYVLSTLRYGASVATSGNTGGAELTTTVFPFILRGANVLGIDSVEVPLERRAAIWARLATDLRPAGADAIATSVTDLDGLDKALDARLSSSAPGRTLVQLS
ncbi:MAG TPA: acryloyl-CoA reductase [Pseudonocardia sp.]|nr:acryloyl-CoA reductase [Pseudonocardia sp.]